MMEHALNERNALSRRVPIGPAGRLSIAVAADCVRLSLRLSPSGREPAAACFGCDLPDRIGGISSSEDRIAICLGPDEWFLMAPLTEAGSIEARFARDMTEAHSLVDVSHREVGIELRGAAAALALSASCALNLGAMPFPSATRTILDKAQVVLVKHAPDHYRVEVWQSFANHVWALLQATAREIALDI